VSFCCVHTYTHTYTDRHTDTHTDHTDTYTDTQTDTHTDTHTEHSPILASVDMPRNYCTVVVVDSGTLGVCSRQDRGACVEQSSAEDALAGSAVACIVVVCTVVVVVVRIVVRTVRVVVECIVVVCIVCIVLRIVGVVVECTVEGFVVVCTVRLVRFVVRKLVPRLWSVAPAEWHRESKNKPLAFVDRPRFLSPVVRLPRVLSLSPPHRFLYSLSLLPQPVVFPLLVF